MLRKWRFKAPLFIVLMFVCSVIGLPPVIGQTLTIDESKESSESRYGSHIDSDGWVHFVVFAPNATQVDLLLYDKPEAKSFKHKIPMYKLGDDWKVKIKGTGIGHGLLYMYSATGPQDVSIDDQFGNMFNEHYPLNDPYAYDTQDVSYSQFFSSSPHVDTADSRYAGGGKSIVYDHSKDPQPKHVQVKKEDLIVYELHVQDYTARIQSLDKSKRGTYVGLATSGLTTPGGLSAGIDHLKELGVTAVELMPVMEYDQETGNVSGRLNHWGYMTTNFFAPEHRYASEPGQDVIELKKLIKAFHDKGIAVFLDVVYNHTGEGGTYPDSNKLAGKYYNFRGLSNTSVYKSTNDGRYYYNATGTGNDLDFRGQDDSRYTKRLTTDSLGMWYDFYGIDGFRFDLARILADNSDSAADWVDNDPDFLNAYLHAEPWDMGGVWFAFMDSNGYSYKNNRWAKWLGKYRDNIRNFSKGTLAKRSSFKRLIEGKGDNGEGSPASTKPWRSVNFLAIHDGYTLRDCVYFNNSGGSHNCWDSGGDENLRRERQKLLMGVLLTSQGVPLILQGDEFGRTKASARSHGSDDDVHNTYNYESQTGDLNINNVNWIDWRLKDGDNSMSPEGPNYGKELFHWTKSLIQLRKQWSHFRRADFADYASQASNGGIDADSKNDNRFTYSFEGSGDGAATQLAVIWWGKAGEPDLMVIYNEDSQELNVSNLGDWSQGDWKILARSWYGDDADFCGLDGWEQACPDAGTSIKLKGHSMAILISDND
ncbi:MAG: hypothetical protein D3919_14565 [Candidatus Electrothrix sp. AW5]|nr:hypothetical protein [Candidatus Electrothrix gigas]